MEEILAELTAGDELVLWFGGHDRLECTFLQFIKGSNWEGPVLKVLVDGYEGNRAVVTHVYARKLFAVTLLDEQELQ